MRVFLCCLLLACNLGWFVTFGGAAVVRGGKRSAGGAPES